MKLRHLLPAAAALLLSGCGLLTKTLGTVAHTGGALLRTVTAPVRGVMNAADEGSEKAWQEKADAQSPQPKAHDRRRTQTKRPR